MARKTEVYDLQTLLAIEEVIKAADLSVNRNKIFARLPIKVKRSIFNRTLSYMEKCGFILETRHGFIWTWNPRLHAYVRKHGVEV